MNSSKKINIYFVREIDDLLIHNHNLYFNRVYLMKYPLLILQTFAFLSSDHFWSRCSGHNSVLCRLRYQPHGNKCIFCARKNLSKVLLSGTECQGANIWLEVLEASWVEAMDALERHAFEWRWMKTLCGRSRSCLFSTQLLLLQCQPCSPQVETAVPLLCLFSILSDSRPTSLASTSTLLPRVVVSKLLSVFG